MFYFIRTFYRYNVFFVRTLSIDIHIETQGFDGLECGLRLELHPLRIIGRISHYKSSNKLRLFFNSNSVLLAKLSLNQPQDVDLKSEKKNKKNKIIII